MTELRLPVTPDAPALARAGVAAVTALPEGSAQDLQLLTSELVSNVVRHSGLGATDEMTVRIEDLADRIRVAVTDHGSRDPDLSTRARGLELVDRLSTRWSVDREGSRTIAWFELCR
jgi:anti-sigma regulatory factor (Ser/Thr protein kinase)